MKILLRIRRRYIRRDKTSIYKIRELDKAINPGSGTDFTFPYALPQKHKSRDSSTEEAGEG